ncbi:MAG: hypothetical protein IT165_16530 [Bryobacterales bacterium]|nr:hypothetical protein [Bryobacterales bacterium]
MAFQTTCPNCRGDLGSNSSFCGHCGANMTERNLENPLGALSKSQSPAGAAGVPMIEHHGKLDRIVFAAFRLGKSIAVVMTLLFFLVFLAAGVTLTLTTRSSFQTPQFEATHPNGVSATGELKTDTSGIRDRQDVERRWGDRLRKILENYSLDAKGYDILLSWTMAVPKDHREEFVSGMERFMTDGVAFAKSNNKQSDTSELIGKYNRMFTEALEAESGAKTEAQQTRLITLAVLGGSALLFFVFLIIPALLQIEKNTRTISA